MSHKICGTGHGDADKATASTNCRSGAKGGTSGSEALTNGGACKASENTRVVG
ncbi:MAG: hypothetical protein ACTJLL_02440 [Anaplasma sp.]